MLAYHLQVQELEKIARLEGVTPARTRELPRLAALRGAAPATCVVCAGPAGACCEACQAAHYCGVEHQTVDAVWHDVVCARLREAETDAALLRESARDLALRLLQRDVTQLPTSWGGLLGDGDAPARRAESDLSSRALTLARLLHDVEVPCHGAVRVHVMGASAKELEGLDLFMLLPRFFPQADFEVALVGPELPIVDVPARERLRFTLHSAPYRRALWSALGQPHFILAFNAGVLLYRSWHQTLFELFKSGVPFALTSYRGWEAWAEARVLSGVGATCVREPYPNPFASLACRRSTTLQNDVSFDNSFVSIWR